jgi:hypothetical protein
VQPTPIADINGAASLLAATAPSERFIGATIPNKINRKRRFPFDAELYRRTVHRHRTHLLAQLSQDTNACKIPLEVKIALG